ncbi:Blp family class II bacteriocin [Staphylococcus hominis]|uniref:Blp family class II bacteriocin n=1 Tax=Staphylococcus hominis TaxID=1290 RepID=UPI000C7BB285|nr:Blp family class II bacteriocin [Staphylococcus hominis]MCI2921920.1 Blp family class II bacteriocin [Staphylococcus hominis]MDS3888283.1 Blp family class II bacteriocin [Staphylococcus hominis]MDS3899180.1 Blp family class II bacteriocin [Staphylococcus hominis]MDS3916586.1 Blp family class II bacteriocin [Staphylococcus hominis]PLA22446.1 bacteriocin leader domain-containing protein [Staphylococcus hominis]
MKKLTNEQYQKIQGGGNAKSCSAKQRALNAAAGGLVGALGGPWSAAGGIVMGGVTCTP